MRKRYLKIVLLSILTAVLAGCSAPQTADDIVLATSTPKPTSTMAPQETLTPEPTSTMAPKETLTPEPTATSTPTPEPTATSTPTPEPTATSTPTPEPTATSTPTPEPTATSTPTPEPTATSTPTPEPTPTNTPTPIPSPTPTVTPVPKPEYYTMDNWTRAKEGDKVRFGAFEQDNNLTNGPETIEWVIVEEDETHFCLFCPTALTAQPHAAESNLNFVWRDSLVRKWMNNTFYQEAFSSKEKEKIALIQKEHWFAGDGRSDMSVFLIMDTWVEDDTQDYVVLPDANIIGSIVYGSLGNVNFSCSEYAKAQKYDEGYFGTMYTTFWADERTEDGFYGTAEIDRVGSWLPSSVLDPTKCFFVQPVIWVAKDGTAVDKTFYTDEAVFKTKEKDGGVVITGVTDTTYTEMYIPPTINGKKVVGISENAFLKCKELARVKLPENLKTLDTKAFAGCTALEELFIPSTMERLDENLYDVVGSLKVIEHAENLSASVKKSVRSIEQDILYEENKEIWDVINADTARYGLWDLTYLEFIEMYRSIGTENDLFLQMLKEKGPAHTGDKLYYEYDGVKNLEITFESVTAEKIYALHYAPFEYSHEDLALGQQGWGKSDLEAYQDHGGVCDILVNVYRSFIRDILGERDWRYQKYSNKQVDHAVLLVQTEDGKVFQIDNAEADYWWLGIEFLPDYSKMTNPEETSNEVEEKFSNWKKEFGSQEQYLWHNFIIYADWDWGTDQWNIKRPVRYNAETGEAETYLGGDIPQAYTVTYPGLPGKVLSMAGYFNPEGYCKLENIIFVR